MGRTSCSILIALLIQEPCPSCLCSGRSTFPRTSSVVENARLGFSPGDDDFLAFSSTGVLAFFGVDGLMISLHVGLLLRPRTAKVLLGLEGWLNSDRRSGPGMQECIVDVLDCMECIVCKYDDVDTCLKGTQNKTSFDHSFFVLNKIVF